MFLSMFSLFILLLLVLVIVSDFDDDDDDCDVDFGTITRLGDFDCDLVGDRSACDLVGDRGACDLVGDFDCGLAGDRACDLVGDLDGCLLDLCGDDDDNDNFDACRPIVEAPLEGTVLDGDFDA